MRDYLLLYVNGRRYEIRGAAAFSCLADFLRNDLALVGTKVVCAEGDCGACTVLVGRPHGTEMRYDPVDSCIQFLYQLDCSHLVTVEGLAPEGQLHPVQQALIEHHGSQCGYCTPGFVMALAGLCQSPAALDAERLRLGLTGNLCRCTGYLPILEAGQSLAPQTIPPLTERYASSAMRADLQEHLLQPVLLDVALPSPQGGSLRHTFFSPRQLPEALDFKAHHPEAVIVAGGTELGVLRNKQAVDPPVLLSLAFLPELSTIRHENGSVVFGANVTWTQIEAYMKSAVPAFYEIILRFGSPQIRHVATLVGNLAHGSPIADALPFLLIMEAELELVRRNGYRRVPLTQFYTGYKRKDLGADEVISRVFVPLPAADEWLKLYKVSKRNDLDIATVGAGIRIKRAGPLITRAFVAFSGVAPTVVRLPGTEAFLQGKRFVAETFRQAGLEARQEIQPISDVRGSREYRLQLAENLLRKFYLDCVDGELPVGNALR